MTEHFFHVWTAIMYERDLMNTDPGGASSTVKGSEILQPSQAHLDAVNRRRRIVVQYDAKGDFDWDIARWVDHYFAYVDEPGNQIDSVFWDGGFMHTYPVDPEQRLLRLDFTVPPHECRLGENQVSLYMVRRDPYAYPDLILLQKVEVHANYEGVFP